MNDSILDKADNKVIPIEVSDAWAAELCARFKWDPKKTQARVVKGFVVQVSLHDMAKSLIRAVLSASPEDHVLNAKRYSALRNGNAYAPEEHYVRGGEQLDALCDDLIAGRELKGTYL